MIAADHSLATTRSKARFASSLLPPRHTNSWDTILRLRIAIYFAIN